MLKKVKHNLSNLYAEELLNATSEAPELKQVLEAGSLQTGLKNTAENSKIIDNLRVNYQYPSTQLKI